MKRAMAAVAAAMMMAMPAFAQRPTDTVDCSAFRKQPDGYLVTRMTRLTTPDMDVTLPSKMPIRRGQKAASVHGRSLAEIIDQKCAGKAAR